MEKRVNTKLETYIMTLKQDFKQKMFELDFTEKDKVNDFIEYLNEYERITIEKEEFIRRNRVQNAIPNINRCNAKLQDGKQCTRQKRKDSEYCGTHYKNNPYGSIKPNDSSNRTLNVFAVDIQGIIYYLDENNNVYRTEDILEEKMNPRIVAKATCENNVYHIPNLGI